ncbi:hypothetical protein E0E02_06875, partial [Streptococcus sp. KCJ4932]
MDFSTLCSYTKNRLISSNMSGTLKELNCLGYNFKDSVELNTFLGFVNFLKNDNEELTLHSCTDYFFFGYQIPQLGKEMDLIRFGKNY